MYFALANLKSSNRGLLNRRHGFLSALFISLILTVLAPIMVALVAFIIQPDLFNLLRNHALSIGEYQAYEAAAIEYSYWGYVKLYMAQYLLVGSLSGALWAFILHQMPEPEAD